MFDDVVDRASRSYDNNDKAQLTINHSGMQDELFIHLQDLSNITGQSIMDRFGKVLNSNEEMVVDDTFQIHVGLMRFTKGGGKKSGRALPLFPHLNKTIYSSIVNKKAIIRIVSVPNEFICAAKSIVVCMAKLRKEPRNDFLNLIRKSRQSDGGERSLTYRALALQRRTGLPTDRLLTVKELAAFEEVLDVKIVVIRFVPDSSEPCLTQCSNRKSDDVIFLYNAHDHFHAVVNPHAMFPKRTLCLECLTTYPATSRNHPCSPAPCMVCQRSTCEEGGNTIVCPICHFTCRNRECFDFHKAVPEKGGSSRCSLKKKCPKCHKVIFLTKQKFEDHVCGQYFCRSCSEFVAQDHLCYHRRRGIKATSGKFLFFDFETMQDGVFQCEDGYSPPPTNATCTGCTPEYKCAGCRLCTMCRSPNCGRNIHQPNLVVCQSVCDECIGEPLVQGATCLNCGDLCPSCQYDSNSDASESEQTCSSPRCGAREMVFKGANTLDDFCSWLLTPAHRDTTCLAHNGKGFDFCFLLHFCVSSAGIKPECIYAGSKLMSLHVRDGLNIRFIDSLNFMGMALKKLPKAFGLQPEKEIENPACVTELQKGDFPHLMNTRENQNYVGPFPPLTMYSIDNMNEEGREKFKAWHATQVDKIFDLQAEMLAYCQLDVTILRLACVRFRELFMNVTTVRDDDGEVTGYVDPFAHITIASACMQIYRVNFIEECHFISTTDGRTGMASYKSGLWTMDGERLSDDDIISKKFLSSSIAQIPAQGYVRNSNHSAKSIAWLEWESLKLGREIQHARNRGEMLIQCGSHKYYVDGFDPLSNTIYEFHGCRFHGCRTCMPNRKIKDPRTGFTLDDLHYMTVKRTASLRSMGYAVKEIYECAFDAEMKTNKELNKFVTTDLDIPERMVIRDAFYGGRTSCFTLHYECDPDLSEEIHYVDVCSLYPFINKTAKMPVGHPIIITRDFDMTLKSYFGIAHLRLIPPRDEYVPCLPVRIRGKLTFPLCNTCAAEECQEPCTHTDAERAISGVWCTPEVMVALSQGYKITKIYEVYHYPKTSQYDPETLTGGLFSEQVNLFMKIKTEASGYPDWVHTDEDKNRFISRFESKVGVQLDKDNIAPNPALRSIAKICLNSFWGKLGQRNNKVKTKFISTTTELEKLQHNSAHELHRLHIVNEDVMVVEYDNLETFEEESSTTNEVIAAFTTCFARLELLRHIKTVGKNILYCDTDSLIFVTRRVTKPDGTMGYDVYPELGDSLGELTNELPPGVHISQFVTTAPKSYSYRCSDGCEICKFKGLTLNFRNSRRVNFEAVRDLLFGDCSSITLSPQIQFKRDKFMGHIYNTELVKTVKPTFNKRKILPTFDTVPFGYTENPI